MTLPEQSSLISPSVVLEQVAASIPKDFHKNVIIIGSLAAGYFFFGENAKYKVRTKDVDCLLSPCIEAIPAGEHVANRLFDEKWTLRKTKDGEFNEPGTAETPDNKLPALRLNPPSTKDWFIELLTVPPFGQVQNIRQDHRIITSQGHFSLCSFSFLSLSEETPLKTKFGIYIARPEMMALANLLGHPEIRPETMSGLIGGRKIKRSNKDLGRVLAIAHLSLHQDENALLKWPQTWKEALKKQFPEHWLELSKSIGKGLTDLLNRPNDFEEAWFTCTNGLLAAHPPTLEQLRIDGMRLKSEALNNSFKPNIEIEFDL